MIETQECYVREIHQYQKRDLPGTRFDYPAPLLNVRAYGALTHQLTAGTRYTKLHLYVSMSCRREKIFCAFGLLQQNTGRSSLINS